MAGELIYFWMLRGGYREGYSWYTHALAGAERTPRPALARALTGAGRCARFLGDLESAGPLLREAAAIARATGDREDEALALQSLGIVLLEQGDLAQGERLGNLALEAMRELEGSFPAGPWLVCLSCLIQGQVALARHDSATAEFLLEEAQRRRRTLPFEWGRSYVLQTLGELAFERGEFDQAIDSFQACLDQTLDDTERRFQAEAIAGLGGVAAARERFALAARLFAAAARLRNQLGAGRNWLRQSHAGGEEAARAALAPDVFAAEWARGAAYSMDELVAEARSIRAPADSSAAAALTTREIEVLRLLVQGMADREIADALFISPRTVGGHVSHLLAKLGVDSRTAAAAWGVRHRLV